jgi:L1 cell adhesion molecule like protein
LQNVNAADKTTGKSQKITITNDKGRLSKEDIERMVSEAEKYKTEDEEAAARISAKNGLESYAYSLRNSIEGDLADKIEAADKETLMAKIKETTEWLDGAAEASKDEFDSYQKELEAVANPIMTKVYSAAGGAPGGMPGMPGQGGPGGFPGGAPGAGAKNDEEPSIEEVRTYGLCDVRNCG